MTELWNSIDDLIEKIGTVARVDVLWAQDTSGQDKELRFSGYRIITHRQPNTDIFFIPLDIYPRYKKVASGIKLDPHVQRDYRLLIDPEQSEPISENFSGRHTQRTESLCFITVLRKL